jgi:hypothetical protein
MPLNITTVTNWVVRCADYTSLPSTKETAERKRQQINEAGHCLLEHRVEEVTLTVATTLECWHGDHGSCSRVMWRPNPKLCRCPCHDPEADHDRKFAEPVAAAGLATPDEEDT